MRRMFALIFVCMLFSLFSSSVFAAPYVSADYFGQVGSSYLWDINIHDVTLSSTNPIAGYDLDLMYTSGFEKIIFTGALGEDSPVELSSTGAYYGFGSESILNVGSPVAGILDFKEQTYFTPDVLNDLYLLQSSYLTGNVLKLATVYFSDQSQTLSFTNWYAGLGDAPFNNEVKLFDNSVLLDGPPVPEPASLLLLGSGLAAVALRRRFSAKS